MTRSLEKTKNGVLSRYGACLANKFVANVYTDPANHETMGPWTRRRLGDDRHVVAASVRADALNLVRCHHVLVAVASVMLSLNDGSETCRINRKRLHCGGNQSSNHSPTAMPLALSIAVITDARS